VAGVRAGAGAEAGVADAAWAIWSRDDLAPGRVAERELITTSAGKDLGGRRIRASMVQEGEHKKEISKEREDGRSRLRRTVTGLCMCRVAVLMVQQ
jgi:hypothetical protein